MIHCYTVIIIFTIIKTKLYREEILQKDSEDDGDKQNFGIPISPEPSTTATTPQSTVTMPHMTNEEGTNEYKYFIQIGFLMLQCILFFGYIFVAYKKQHTSEDSEFVNEVINKENNQLDHNLNSVNSFVKELIDNYLANDHLLRVLSHVLIGEKAEGWAFQSTVYQYLIRFGLHEQTHIQMCNEGHDHFHIISEDREVPEIQHSIYMSWNELYTHNQMDRYKLMRYFKWQILKCLHNFVTIHNYKVLLGDSMDKCVLQLTLENHVTVTIELILGTTFHQGRLALMLTHRSLHRSFMDELESPGTSWETSWPLQEVQFFMWAYQTLGPNCCYAQCLKILTFFHSN